MTAEIIAAEDARVLNTLGSLEERNRRAKEVIREYAQMHAAMDVAIGAAGFFGLAIPALIAAVAAQAPVIYRPMARKLESIYNCEGDAETGAIIIENVLIGGIADIAGEFSTEFMVMIAGEVITEIGLGGVAGFVPVVGGLIGAALDYVIATAMTWRVGTMVSIYYQNGGKWIQNRKHTYELAKEMTGGIGFGFKDLLSHFSNERRPELDVDFDSLPRKVPEVKATQVHAAKQILQMLLQAADAMQARKILRAKGFPDFVIDSAFDALSAAVR